MKKFIIKLIIFTLIIATPLLTVNFMYKNTNFYLSMNELYWLKVYPKDIELLNLGNSHEKNSIRMFDKFDGVSHNFATSSQPFYYDYQVLKNVKNSVSKDAVVLIPISLFDWYYNYLELFKEDVASYNKRYYSLLPASSIYKYDFEDDVKYNYLPVLTAKENLKYIINDVELPKQEAAVYYTNSTAVKNLAEQKYDSWINHVMKQTNEVRNDNIKWFKKTVDLCYDSGYKPVVIITPIPYTLNEKFSDEIIEDFYNTNEKVVSEYPDLLLLDYSKDEEFTKNLNYYRDADHMNTYGADAYSKKILDDLVKQKYISENKIISTNKMTE